MTKVILVQPIKNAFRTLLPPKQVMRCSCMRMARRLADGREIGSLSFFYFYFNIMRMARRLADGFYPVKIAFKIAYGLGFYPVNFKIDDNHELVLSADTDQQPTPKHVIER